jgi:hypothetical protein
MVRRLIALLAAVLFVFLAVDIVQGFTVSSTDHSTMLIAVDVEMSGSLERFEKSGLTAYALLAGQRGAYLLAGVDEVGLSTLQSLGLEYRIVEEDVRGHTYYLAYQVPDRPVPRWQDYGKLLLDDGVQVLLRMNETKADHLAALGFEIQKLFMKPIVLMPEDSSDRFPSFIDPDPTIQSMMDQVISTTVYQYDGNLSGEWPVIVGGQPYTIVSRNTDSGEPIEKATEYVAEHMGNLGLDIEYHTWNASRPPNVIGEMTGETHPSDIFLITAHLDDMPSGAIAPGADDNASGSTAVMIASDIFSHFQWGCTLRFAFFTGEEQGLLGSNAYAQRSSTAGENIVGVLNLDMLGWNTPGSSRTIDLGAESSVPGSVAIANLFSDVIDAYSIDLIPQISTSGTCCSDHVPFLNNGYAAILGIEDWSDHTPYYHTTNDLLDSLNLDYFTDFVRASIGTFAHMASCMIPTESGYLQGHVSQVEEGPPIEGAEVTMVSDTGWEAYTTTDSSGYYTSTVDIGTYTVTVSAEEYIPSTVAGVEVLTDTVTTLDFTLVPVSKGALEGHVSDGENGAIIVGASVNLEDGAGWNTTVATDGTGYYTATVEIGTYTVTVSADDFYPASVGGVVILTDTVSILDFDLIRANYNYYLPTIILDN